MSSATELPRRNERDERTTTWERKWGDRGMGRWNTVVTLRPESLTIKGDIILFTKEGGRLIWLSTVAVSLLSFSHPFSRVHRPFQSLFLSLVELGPTLHFSLPFFLACFFVHCAIISLSAWVKNQTAARTINLHRESTLKENEQKIWP
ncbi:hypothetical protein I3842_16G014200 [Carya illinoinensis]|uniref:Uncharacterized protein n=1 Tax=Carya illinoinensis TaxID=32201 RepID=A0A922A7I2_CARIL|nr:hypothetical protein I3842_16G014200 [Carya illinoinensis]